MNKIDLSLFEALARLGANSERYDKNLNIISSETSKVARTFKVELNQKLKNEFKYLGEFYERHEEKGYVLDETTFTTMLLYYAMGYKVFTENEFNDYQIKDFEKIINETSFSNAIINLSLYLLEDNEDYLENAFKQSISIRDLYFITSILFTLGEKEMVKTIVNNYEKVVEDKNLFVTNYIAITDYISLLALLKPDKEYKTYNAYVKLIDGKVSSKGIITHLEEKGITSTDLECLSFLIKRRCCNGDLKQQKALASALETLISLESSYTDLEKTTLREILSYGRFRVKMESGTITNLNQLINSNKYQYKIPNFENFMTFANLVTKENILSFSEFKIEIDKDEHWYEKTKLIAESDNTNAKSLFKELFANNIYDIYYGTPENMSERMKSIVNIYEKKFDINILELFNDGPWCLASERTYIFLCKAGVLSAVDNIVNGKVKFSFSREFFWKCDTREKYEAIKALNEKNEDIIPLFSSYVFERRESGTLFLTDVTPEEQKEYLNIIGEYALALGIKKFQNFFFNVMTNNDKIVNIYSKEEINELYNAALELAETMESGGGYYYYNAFSKDSLIRDLNVYYMTEEEKERRKREKEEAEAEKLRLEKEKLNKETELAIKEILEREEFLTASSYGKITLFNYILNYREKSTIAYKEHVIAIATQATIFEKEAAKFIELIACLMKENIIDLETAQNIVAKITIIQKEEIEDEEKVA